MKTARELAAEFHRGYVEQWDDWVKRVTTAIEARDAEHAAHRVDDLALDRRGNAALVDKVAAVTAERDRLRAALTVAREALEEITAEEYLKTADGHPVPIADRALARIAALTEVTR